MTPNADSGPYPYYADWIDDPKLPHGGVYAVRCATAVICRTGPYKKGWEEAQTIAAAMNEKARSDLPPNVDSLPLHIASAIECDLCGYDIQQAHDLTLADIQAAIELHIALAHNGSSASGAGDDR